MNLNRTVLQSTKLNCPPTQGIADHMRVSHMATRLNLGQSLAQASCWKLKGRSATVAIRSVGFLSAKLWSSHLKECVEFRPVILRFSQLSILFFRCPAYAGGC